MVDTSGNGYRNGPRRTRREKNLRKYELYQELMQYQRQGIPLWLNGEPSTSQRIAECLCERNDYMRDYHTDGQNRICGIGFDMIGGFRERKK